MKNKYKKIVWMLCFILLFLIGCSDTSNQEESEEAGNTTPGSSQSKIEFVPEMQVSFGREGEPFTMKLEDNETVRAISTYVGSQDWNLPIYHYDDYENYEVMQYYDIPSRYDIPSNPEVITSQKAGDVYYSKPNRIVLFYQDATIPEEYTKIGTIEASEAFVSAVIENPVVEGWSNKIVSIRPAR